MDKSKKKYVKALDKYNNGYISKALELCEESISIDIKNTAAINLKGLLYYLKGDLEEAQKLWKMNFQINKDSVAQKYLNDTKKDVDRIKSYNLALNYIKQLKISEAIELLEKCSESDCNFINVNNYTALCHIKKGQYYKAAVYIDNVLGLDKNDKMAKESKLLLQKLGVAKRKVDARKVIYSLLIILCIVSLILLLKVFSRQIKNEFTKVENKMVSVSKYKNNFSIKSNGNVKKNTNDSNKGGNKDNISKASTDKSEQEAFPMDKVNTDLQNKNFEELYEINGKWKDKSISINEKTILSKADDLLKDEGVEYFYNKGSNYMASKDYSNAKENLIKAYNVGQQNYLYPDILYTLANCFQLSGDVENAVKYYTQYTDNFSGGDYEETVLYNLVIIYKDVDKSKAKVYAEQLSDKYQSSIYNNSIVKDIVNN